MIDKRFYLTKPAKSVQEIADYLGCELFAPKEVMIENIASLESAGSSDLAFLNNDKYAKLLLSSSAAAVIVKKSLEVKRNNLIVSDNPYYSYAKAIELFYAPYPTKATPHAIDPSIKIGKNAVISHHVVIEEEVEIGENAEIASGVFIGRGVKIGDNVKIGHNVTVSYSIIGDNVVILSGARIGQDGFGFATEKGKHHKIFHVGRVIIGDDVEIGANTTIDRGSLQDTIISDGVRIDNLVQIGHNVQIGRGSIIVAQVGIAGSSKVGSYCALGGQVGVSGHITIADRVQIAGQGGVIQDIKEEGCILGGTPTVPLKDWHKQSIMLKNLVKNKR